MTCIEVLIGDANKLRKYVNIFWLVKRICTAPDEEFWPRYIYTWPDQTGENFANKSVKIIRLQDNKITACQRIHRAEKLPTNADLMHVHGQQWCMILAMLPLRMPS